MLFLLLYLQGEPGPPGPDGTIGATGDRVNKDLACRHLFPCSNSGPRALRAKVLGKGEEIEASLSFLQLAHNTRSHSESH